MTKEVAEETHPSPAKQSFSFLNVLVLAVPLAAIVVFAYFYVMNDARNQSKPLNFLAQIKRALLPTTTLVDGLSDENGDLIADAPKDEKELLDPEMLVFTVLGPNLEQEKERWKDFTDHLAKVTGKAVEVASAVPRQGITPADASYAHHRQLSNMREGKVHVVALSTGQVSAAVNEGGIVPVCVMANKDGDYGYEMEMIVPASSALKSPSDVKGKRVLFANIDSHSGFKAPVVILANEFKLQPEVDYLPTFAGDQEGLIRQVTDPNSKIDAAFVASDLLNRMVERGEVKKDTYRSIYKSKQYPPACFGYAHQLKPELAEKVKDAFLNFSWEGSSLAKAYEAANQSKFVAVDYKKDWEAVRAIEQSLIEMLNAGTK
jgi:phosphonate transport system substrate-binding protein